MDRPHIPDAPGLAWRERKNGWAAVWLARQDFVKEKGFKPSTRQIAIFDQQPDDAQANDVRAACVKFQEEMYAFGVKQPKVFAGTVRALISAYQTDPDSPHHAMRYNGRRHTDALLKRIDGKYGALKLADLGARDFKRWYEDIRWPDGKDGRDITTTAHAAITAVRMMFGFGVMFEIDSQCVRLKAILSEMAFEKGKGRTEVVTVRQCEDVIIASNAAGLHSIALTQALQRNLGIRQKDAIGEWVPNAEPGVSEITRHGRKWLRGLRWEEISNEFILTHKMSKSRTGKVIEFDLKLYPMVMAELLKIPEKKRVGPVVICELTGRPWKQNNFRIRWREMATKAGVPADVMNMDSRAGAITEIIAATGGNIEAARKQAGHSDARTTQGYSREQLQSNSDTAVIVADFRAKNRA